MFQKPTGKEAEQEKAEQKKAIFPKAEKKADQAEKSVSFPARWQTGAEAASIFI